MNKSIRLSEQDLTAIKNAFLHHFSSKDHLWIFGSRVDMDKRGGDIDLYIETMSSNLEEVVSKKIYFLVDIKEAIGDQKIDVVIKTAQGKPLEIYKEARDTGVQLL